MRKFLIKILIFVLAFAISITLSLFLVNTFISKKGDFKLPKDTKFVVFGHSHSKCAFNDSVISNLQNVSFGGESYFYSFPKLKQVIDHNPDIEYVFIEFTNSQITKNVEEWMWGNKYLSYHYCIYSPYIKLRDKMFLFVHAPINYLKVIPIEIKYNASRIIKKEYNFNNYWGFTSVTGDLNTYLDSLNKGVEVVDMIEIDEYISENHLQYLDKMIEYVESQNKTVILVRSPIHKDYEEYFLNENAFQELVKQRYSDITFLDFSNYYLPDSCYKDYRHLNYDGSLVFSKWFNNFISDSLIN